MILVQDIGDIYKLTEADFEISIFLEFYGRFQVKIWPFSGLYTKNHYNRVHKIPKKVKFKNPAVSL